jgi:xanthine/CO dehydrogenase XdhC/CoxF family maturation factor
VEGIAGKAPEVIAIAVVAQMLQAQAAFRRREVKPSRRSS